MFGDKNAGASGDGRDSISALTGPPIQRVVWAPPVTVAVLSSSGSNASTVSSNDPSPVNSVKNNNESENKGRGGDNQTKSSLLRRVLQPLAFVYNYDIYFKPSIQGETIYRITKNGE